MKNYVSRMARCIGHSFYLAYIKLFCENILIGKHFRYRKRLELNCDKKGHIEIGDNVFLNNDCSINSHKSIKIGSNCLLGENVKIYDHNHIFYNNGIPIYKQGFSCNDVSIGNDCWIGSNCVILSGSHIGDHVVIGAGCIISNVNIPSGTLVKNKSNLVMEAIRDGR